MRKNLFKQNMKRALGLLLAVVMVLGLLPMAVLAAPGYDEPVTVSTPHATVGNDWDALQAALSTAQDGDIINLTAAIVVPVGQDWTLGFMGGNVTLQVTGNFRHFLVDGTLTLNDGVTLQGRRPSSFTEDGTIPPDLATWPNGGGLTVQNGARFNMNGGIITGNGAARGGGINVIRNSTLNMTGDAVISNNRSTGTAGAGAGGGGGVAVTEASTFNMDGGTIKDNVAVGLGVYIGGGGVLVGERLAPVGSTLIMTGGEITRNAGGRYGGGVSIVGGGSTFTLYDGLISENMAAILNGNANGSGGGVWVARGAEFIMHDGTISKNQSGIGGGVRINANDSDGTRAFLMNGGEIIYNTALGGAGGGIYGNTAIMTAGRIANNIANSSGGGIFGALIMSGGEITDNTSGADGGGLRGTGEITGGVISGNISLNNRGGNEIHSMAAQSPPYIGGTAVIGGSIAHNGGDRNGVVGTLVTFPDGTTVLSPWNSSVIRNDDDSISVTLPERVSLSDDRGGVLILPPTATHDLDIVVAYGENMILSDGGNAIINAPVDSRITLPGSGGSGTVDVTFPAHPSDPGYPDAPERPMRTVLEGSTVTRDPETGRTIITGPPEPGHPWTTPWRAALVARNVLRNIWGEYGLNNLPGLLRDNDVTGVDIPEVLFELVAAEQPTWERWFMHHAVWDGQISRAQALPFSVAALSSNNYDWNHVNRIRDLEHFFEYMGPIIERAVERSATHPGGLAYLSTLQAGIVDVVVFLEVMEFNWTQVTDNLGAVFARVLEDVLAPSDLGGGGEPGDPGTDPGDPGGPGGPGTDPGDPGDPVVPGPDDPPREWLPAESTNPFVDVPNGNWQNEPVSWAVRNGIATGIANTNPPEFRPNTSLNRETFATFLHRVVGTPEAAPTGFADNASISSWARDAVEWGVEAGIILGFTDNTFRPQAVITREQIATMLFRFAEYLEKDLEFETATFDAFPDRGQVRPWALEAMQWATYNGLITGVARGGVSRLEPQGNATRAQAVAVIYRFVMEFEVEPPAID